MLDTFAREEKEKEKKNDWKRIEEAKITVASLRPDQKRTDVDIFEHGEYRIVSCTCGVWTPDASLILVSFNGARSCFQLAFLSPFFLYLEQ